MKELRKSGDDSSLGTVLELSCNRPGPQERDPERFLHWVYGVEAAHCDGPGVDSGWRTGFALGGGYEWAPRGTLPGIPAPIDAKASRAHRVIVEAFHGSHEMGDVLAGRRRMARGLVLVVSWAAMRKRPPLPVRSKAVRADATSREGLSEIEPGVFAGDRVRVHVHPSGHDRWDAVPGVTRAVERKVCRVRFDAVEALATAHARVDWADWCDGLAVAAGALEGAGFGLDRLDIASLRAMADKALG